MFITVRRWFIIQYCLQLKGYANVVVVSAFGQYTFVEVLLSVKVSVLFLTSTNTVCSTHVVFQRLSPLNKSNPWNIVTWLYFPSYTPSCYSHVLWPWSQTLNDNVIIVIIGWVMFQNTAQTTCLIVCQLLQSSVWSTLWWRQACNELISLSHDPRPSCTQGSQRRTEQSCRFKTHFPPLSNSREQEEGNESTDTARGPTYLNQTHCCCWYTDNGGLERLQQDRAQRRHTADPERPRGPGRSTHVTASDRNNHGLIHEVAARRKNTSKNQQVSPLKLWQYPPSSSSQVHGLRAFPTELSAGIFDTGSPNSSERAVLVAAGAGAEVRLPFAGRLLHRWPQSRLLIPSPNVGWQEWLLL